MSRSKKATYVVSWVGLNDYHVNTWMECKQSKLVGLAREKQSALDTPRYRTLRSCRTLAHSIQDKLD